MERFKPFTPKHTPAEMRAVRTPDDITPVGPVLDFSEASSDNSDLKTILRNVLDEKLKPFGERVESMISGLQKLQSHQVNLELRMQALERREHKPSIVAWLSLALGLVDLGLVLSAFLR